MDIEPTYMFCLNPIEAQTADVPIEHRDAAKKLAGNVLAAQLQQAIGSDVSAAVRTLRSKGIKLERQQVRPFFEGRHTLQQKNIGQIGRALRLPELLRLNEFPWRLFSSVALSIADIEGICASSCLRNEPSASQLRRGQSRWIRPHEFQERVFEILQPGNPEDFWRCIASYRAAEAKRDYESMNYYRWMAVTKLRSLSSIPAVDANLRSLFVCMETLTRRIKNNRWIWFSVDWYRLASICRGSSDDHGTVFLSDLNGPGYLMKQHHWEKQQYARTPEQFALRAGLIGSHFTRLRSA